MGKDDVDDIFKDFEYKVANKKEAPKSSFASKLIPRQSSEEELLEEKYQKEKELLEKKRKEEAKRNKEAELRENIMRQKSMPSKPVKKTTVNVERIGYLAIIIVLIAYIVIDLSFYHGGKSDEAKKNQAVAPAIIVPNATIEQNKSNESNESKTVVEEKKEEKKEEPVVPAANEGTKLSGKITLKISNIATEISESLNDTGYINSVTFTIENGKDKILTPFVEVFAYDDTNKEDYETKSRGHYIYKIGINPGDKHTGSIDLSPKTFKNLDLEKHIRLVLNDTKDGYIDAVNKVEIIS